MIFGMPKLYKRDTAGKVRTLEIQYICQGVATPGTRTISGLKDGKLVTSGWKETFSKNTGKVNGTTAGEQATSEAQAMWDKKVKKEYFEYESEIDTYDLFDPMLAHDYTKRPQSEGYCQPKLDGIRCIARADGLYTRNGKHITSCQHIINELAEFFVHNPNVILDGELYNHELKADFNKITSLVRKVTVTAAEAAECAEMVQYHIYDTYDKEAVERDFAGRTQFLETELFPLNSAEPNVLVLVPTSQCSSQEELDQKYAEYTEAGYEGQMVRNNTPYDCKRSKNLLKRKEFITEEFAVNKVCEGQGNWAGYAKRFELKLPDGRIFGCGVRGNQATLKALLEGPEMPNWVTCRYFELSPDGVPRFPVAIDWGVGDRDD